MKSKNTVNMLGYVALSCSFISAAVFSNAANAINLTPIPPHLAQTRAAPQTMLNMSRDHQLFYKAYNEYSNLDSDDLPETQYKHSYGYYGYFDNKRCYIYSAEANQFNPASKANAADNYCGGANEWSGNFLNWASMTRIDVVRRILYGGLRSTDTADETVLERAHLPTDAHSFAKYYAGTDIRKLTPFNETEITLCNATYGASTGVNRYSHTNTNAPTIRVAKGNYSLWNANERWQCYWNEERTAANNNGNVASVSGINASPTNPYRDGNNKAFLAEYSARIKVCDRTVAGGFTADEQFRCRQYPVSKKFKPVGLLHKYGEGNVSAFGLMTGSFDNNISGGVLRKNIESFSNEVNSSTDGTFVSTARGIVFNLNKLRIYGYDYNDGTYIGKDSCSFQQIGLNDGTCTSWGNPMGEIFLESLRYMAGKSPTAGFAAGTKDNEVGMTTAEWKDPFAESTETAFGARACRPLNVVNFSASVNSYDGNSLAGFSDLNPTAGQTLTNLTDFIGKAENIYDTNSQWFVGSSGTITDNLCTAKSISSLANARGVCPEAPSYNGSYAIAGLALHAHINRIRTDIPATDPTQPTNGFRPFRVNTYGVSLSTSTPSIRVPVGSSGQFVLIQPAYRLEKDAGGGGSLVDFRVVQQTPTYGKYVVQWEDSEQGGDYDQDVWGTLEYKVTGGNQLEVSTFIQAESTSRPQGFGYTITGTNGKDGVHFHSGIKGFTFTDPRGITVTPKTNINASGGCNKCEVAQPKTTAFYTMVGVPDAQLKDPLWYAAKYGKFDRTVAKNYVLGSELEKAAWDAQSSSGTGEGDGTPDGYFLAVNPDQLERSLSEVFKQLFDSGGAAPAASSSRSLTEAGVFSSSYKYTPQTVTEDTQASGEFSKYAFDDSGNLKATSEWDASSKLPSASDRKIITNDAGTGKPFRWANLSNTAQTVLNTNSAGTVDSLGQARLRWVRGDPTVEAPVGSAGLRSRGSNKIGAIINSAPWYLGKSAARYSPSFSSGGTGETYPEFRAKTEKRSVVFVGSNGGMLHAFDAATGNELLGYVPGAVLNRLSLLTSKAYNLDLTVDGGVFAGDIKDGGLTGQWKTYLFGTLGRGGRGIYALDVTDPNTFSEANAASIAKWEFTETDDADLGSIVGRTTTEVNNQPSQIVFLNNNRWAVIFGNGYNSASGQTTLYILFVEGPRGPNKTWRVNDDFIKIQVGTADTNLGGLSTPQPLDVNQDGKTDFIYAGDLNGNMWKFDVRSATPSSWTAAFSGKPLFRAVSPTNPDEKTNGQPITTAPVLIPHPTSGVMVNFGTGRSLGAGDFPSTTINALYGIWDKAATVAEDGAPVTRDKLQAREMVTKTVTVDGEQVLVRGISNTPIDWTTKLGWYIALPITGESMIFNPLLLTPKILLMRTIYPGVASDCNANSKGFTMALDPITGGPSINAIDVNNDGVGNAGDQPFSDEEKKRGILTGGISTDGNFDFSRARLPDKKRDPADPPKLDACGDIVNAISRNGAGSSSSNSGVSTTTFGGNCGPRKGWREITRNR
jgi:type IV pilus assembly protein PilY1